VFDVAFRGDSARTPGDAGAGLGLAIARGFVEAHRGDITVRNENGGGPVTVPLPPPPGGGGGGARARRPVAPLGEWRGAAAGVRGQAGRTSWRRGSARATR